MSIGMKYVKQAFPEIRGLFDTDLQQSYQWTELGGENYVQIFHVNNNHWITASNIFAEAADIVDLYDSADVTYSPPLLAAISRFHQCSEPTLTVRVKVIHKQLNAFDCGAFALAFATALSHNQDPTCLHFNDPRAHLRKCFQENQISPFPAHSRTPQTPDRRYMSVPVYCMCRGTDDGSRMIACDSCREWFHQMCVLGRGVRPPKGAWMCHECR